MKDWKIASSSVYERFFAELNRMQILLANVYYEMCLDIIGESKYESYHCLSSQ